MNQLVLYVFGGLTAVLFIRMFFLSKRAGNLTKQLVNTLNDKATQKAETYLQLLEKRAIEANTKREEDAKLYRSSIAVRPSDAE